MLAQKSVSHDALVIEVEENSVDGDVTTRRTRKTSTTRTRLAACSSTPEQAKPFHVQQSTPTATASEALQKVLSLSNAAELGQGDFVDSARHPSGDEKKQKTKPTVEALSAIDQSISFYGASVDDATINTQNVASLTHESEATLANARRSINCQSPNDSNNNEEMATCNFSSVSKRPLGPRLGGQHKRPTDFGQQRIPPFNDDNLHCYNGVSVSISPDDVLYDSDPDATVL